MGVLGVTHPKGSSQGPPSRAVLGDPLPDGFWGSLRQCSPDSAHSPPQPPVPSKRSPRVEKIGISGGHIRDVCEYRSSSEPGGCFGCKCVSILAQIIQNLLSPPPPVAMALPKRCSWGTGTGGMGAGEGQGVGPRSQDVLMEH